MPKGKRKYTKSPLDPLFDGMMKGVDGMMGVAETTTKVVSLGTVNPKLKKPKKR